MFSPLIKKTHAVAGIDHYKNIHYQKVVFTKEILRTVPTNGKYSFPDNDYVRQVDHISGY